MEPVENSSHSEISLTDSNQRVWLRRLLKVIVTLIVVGAVGIGYLYVDDEYGNRLWPKRVTELRGIEIGATRADVLFKIGAPDIIDRDVFDIYDEPSFRYIVQYSGDKVIRLRLIAQGNRQSYPKVAGISTGDYESWLTGELGEPDSKRDNTTSTGAVRRSYHYYKLGVVFDLEKDRVVGIIVQ